MKKLLPIILAAAMAFSLAACTGNSGGGTSNPPATTNGSGDTSSGGNNTTAPATNNAPEQTEPAPETAKPTDNGGAATGGVSAALYDISDDQIETSGTGSPASVFPDFTKKGVATFKAAQSVREKFLHISVENPTGDDYMAIKDYYIANGGTVEKDEAGATIIAFDWGEVTIMYLTNVLMYIDVEVN